MCYEGATDPNITTQVAFEVKPIDIFFGPPKDIDMSQIKRFCKYNHLYV